MWYKQAIEAGNENAKENLKILENDHPSDGKTLIKEYYSIAPRIVAKINSFSDSAEIYVRK